MQLAKNEIELKLAESILQMLYECPIISIIVENSYVTVFFGVESYDEYIDASYHSVSRFPQKFLEHKVDEVIFNEILNSLIKANSEEIYYNKTERGEITLQFKEKITTNNTCKKDLPMELFNYLSSNKRAILAVRKTDSSSNNSVTLANIVLSCDKYYVPDETEGKYFVTLDQILNIDKESFELYKIKEHKDILVFEIINKMI